MNKTYIMVGKDSKEYEHGHWYILIPLETCIPVEVGEKNIEGIHPIRYFTDEKWENFYLQYRNSGYRKKIFTVLYKIVEESSIFYLVSDRNGAVNIINEKELIKKDSKMIVLTNYHTAIKNLVTKYLVRNPGVTIPTISLQKAKELVYTNQEYFRKKMLMSR